MTNLPKTGRKKTTRSDDTTVSGLLTGYTSKKINDTELIQKLDLLATDDLLSFVKMFSVIIDQRNLLLKEMAHVFTKDKEPDLNQIFLDTVKVCLDRRFLAEGIAEQSQAKTDKTDAQKRGMKKI